MFSDITDDLTPNLNFGLISNSVLRIILHFEFSRRLLRIVCESSLVPGIVRYHSCLRCDFYRGEASCLTGKPKASPAGVGAQTVSSSLSSRRGLGQLCWLWTGFPLAGATQELTSSAAR